MMGRSECREVENENENEKNAIAWEEISDDNS